MADFAGAVRATKDKLDAEWTTTRILHRNEQPAQPWPPLDDVNGELAPFVFAEVVGLAADINGFGTPGNQVVRDDGQILLTIFVPVGWGEDVLHQHAVALGEIFRNKKFYDADPNAYVRSWTPRITDGASAAAAGVPNGNWFGKVVTIPFEFYHRA